MGIFNSIKKSRRASDNIDEKIEYLNKELDKNGLREAMVTSNMYVSGGRIPNQTYNNFNGLSHGGYGLGLSGGDGNGAGGGSVGTITLDMHLGHAFTGRTGVAISPPHPITGQRSYAKTQTGIGGYFEPLRPGTKQGNYGGSLRGGALWFFDPDYNFGGQVGRWLNFEWSPSQKAWCWYDTSFITGSLFLNPNLDQYQLRGVNIGTQIKNTIAAINFGDNGEVGTPQTLVLTKNNLDDPGFLPIPIEGLSTQGFNYLKGKAGVKVSSSYYSPEDKKNVINYYKKKQADPNYQPKPYERESLMRQMRAQGDDGTQIASTDPSAAFPSAPPDAFEPETVETELTPDDIPDEFKIGNNTNTVDESKPTEEGKGVKLTKWISRTDYMSKYPNTSVVDYLNSLPYGPSDFMTPNPNYNNAWDLNRKGYENYFLNGDLSALGNREGIPKPRHSAATPEPEKKGKTREEIISDLEKLSKELKQSELEAYVEANRIALELGMDFISLIGGLFTGGTTAAPVLGKLGMKLLKKYGKTVAGKMIRKLIKKFRNNKNSKQLDKLIDDIEKGGNESGVAPEPPLDLVQEPARPPVSPKPKPKPGEPGSQYDAKGRKRFIPQVDPLRGSGLFDSNKLDKEKLLSEAAKLGYFEPEVLNVDINDIRKGIMPEFPKDPPPEMIDGYSVKSRLAPKKIDKDPFIKITKKDLAKNHRLKDSEIKDFMDTINAVNDFIKKHPEELVYAQTRYPKNDPRLAQLNWQMDQMLNAGKEYMDKTFPENEKLFKKIQKTIKKNIELTDPKSFKDVKIPKYEGVNLTDFKRRKEVVSRHFKKAVKIQKLFSNKKRRNNVKEQIEYKDNNLHEFMTTSNMYVSGDRVPNQDVINFLNLNHGGYGLGLSAADGRQYGQAGLGPTGVALSPPHPTTGVIRSARHITSGLGNSTPLRPGQTTTIGFSDNPPTRTMGSALWFYDPNYDSGAGQWYNLEWGVQQGAWGYWDTVKSGQFTGLYIFNTDLSQHPAGDISNKISGINFSNNGSIGEPQTIVLNKNDLGDPGFLPIDIPLSKQGFDYLKDKSEYSDEEDPYAAAKSAYFKAGNQMAWNYLSAKQKEYWKNKASKGDITPEDPSSEDDSTPPDLPVPPDLPDPPSGEQDSSPSESEREPIGFTPTTGTLTKWMSRADFMKMYPNAITNEYVNGVFVDEYIDALPYGSTDFMSPNPDFPGAWDLNREAYYNYIMTGDLSGLGNKSGIPKPRHERTPESDPDIDQQKKELLDKQQSELDNLKGKNVATKIDGALTFLKNAIGATNPIAKIITSIPVGDYGGEILTSMVLNQPIYQGDNDVPLKDKMSYVKGIPPTFFFDQSYSSNNIPSSSTEQPYSDANFYKDPTTGKIKAHTAETRKLYPDNTTTFSDKNPLDVFGVSNPIAVRGNMHTQIVEPEGGEPYIKVHDFAYLNKAKINDRGELQTGVQSKIAQFISPLLDKFHGRKGGSPNHGGMTGYPPNINGVSEMEFKVPYSQWTDKQKEAYNKSRQKNESYISESAKLGHFEPEMLNVDIEKLRQGIMPEFPKDPPPEMINGYSAKSRLAPKTIEGEPFLKITKKDLAKNHRLKDSEIKDFMKQIDAINKYIKENPAELKYVLIRYPKDDPRLAQLNWEMDQKLNASKQFMDKHYPENQKLFTKIKKSIKKNIELTDPKSFKGVKIPKFKGVDLTDYKRRKALVSRHFKKAIRKSKKKT